MAQAWVQGVGVAADERYGIWGGTLPEERRARSGPSTGRPPASTGLGAPDARVRNRPPTLNLAATAA
jgi:hypothetical protein